MNPDPTSLDRLHDIVAPPPVPWWPPAPGWYYVMGATLLVLVVLLVRGFVAWQRNRYRREALAALAREERLLADPARRNAALAALAELLKRTAITAFSRTRVAALTGTEWYAFLDHSGDMSVFSRGAGQQLASAVYDSGGGATLEESAARALAQHIRHWIKHHDPELEQQRPRRAQAGPTDPASRALRPSVQNGSPRSA
jgi:hypothetical protein